ncbi:exopolysaccharide transport family protein [Caballeronia udeis]|uniref:Putative tyrosine-protein kinase EpsB n=1 Tax=Caballeronia udeis TaxID=1232866 RepID=A0A158GH12_9BURK|nr:polysaccharide biosynthesis tyrosine autokinase [Caballeronia udeis]SAL31131.1 exopolysaccharide transport family protein [Caballeronia udeis]
MKTEITKTTAAVSPVEELDLVRYLDVLLANRRVIGVVTAVTLAIGATYAIITPPVYEADMLIQVEDNGMTASSLLGDASSLFDVKTQAAAELEILRSRMVVGKAVDTLQLYIDAKPKYLPVIGSWIASRNKHLSNPGLFGKGGYVWGSESLQLATFDVPKSIEGEKITLTVLSGGAFQLDNPDLSQPIQGHVGTPLQVTQDVGTFRLLVTELHGKPGAQFILVRNSQPKTVSSLQQDLNITPKGKQSGIIGATLRGTDASLAASILNQIGQEYVTQNVERKTAEAQSSLSYLEGQMPRLKAKLSASEERYNALRNKSGTFNLSQEGTTYLQESVASETTLLELKQKQAELMTRFAPGHPALRALDKQISAVSAKSSSVATRMKALPDIEQNSLRLMRDLQVDSDTYVNVVNNVERLKLVKAGKVGTVRQIDFATIPEEPVKPRKAMVLALAAMIGLMLGVIAAFVRDSLFGGLTNAHEIEQHTGMKVYGTVPFSPAQLTHAKAIHARLPGLHLLAASGPNDAPIESLRSFRTALQFGMLGATNNRVVITGPTASIGKSFVSANLAAVLAAAGKRVLLVDADLRKGYLNQYFGKQRTSGLSDLLIETATIDDVVHRDVTTGLDFISTGALPPNPAALVQSERMTHLLEQLSERYDLVIVDTPPVLAVSDTANIASHCATVFLVGRFKHTTIGELLETTKQLEQANVAVKGVIFNGLDAKGLRYGSKYGQYRYVAYEYDKPGKGKRSGK